MSELNKPCLSDPATKADDGSEPLAKLWCDGDERVVRRILAEHEHSFVQRVFRKYGRAIPHDECRDVALNALAKAWLHRSEFDPSQGDLVAWLWTICDHEAADQVRKPWSKERIHERGFDPGRMVLHADHHASATEDGANAPEAGSPLMRLAKEVLSVKQFAIVWAEACSRDGQLSSRELAIGLAIPEGTVRRNRAAARAKLKARRDEIVELGYQIDRDEAIGGGGSSRS